MKKHMNRSSAVNMDKSVCSITDRSSDRDRNSGGSPKEAAYGGLRGCQSVTLPGRIGLFCLLLCLVLVLGGCGHGQQETGSAAESGTVNTGDAGGDTAADPGTEAAQDSTEPVQEELPPESIPDWILQVDDAGNVEVTGTAAASDGPGDGPASAGSKIVFRFAGDFTQAELGGVDTPMAIMETLDSTYGGDITKVFSDDLLELMQSADIFMLNNEFTYSTRGTPTAGKHWTFRADPSRVKNLNILGVDIVGLANNHAFDWGEASLLDTLDTLDGAGIDHVGAGKDLEAAKKAVYYELGGKTFSFVCATAVEKVGDSEYGMSRAAASDAPGVLNTIDPEETLDAIRTAKSGSDYCFVYVHWGTESTTELDRQQRDLAYAYIDAGADAVIGGHPHVLQGMEFYDGKPIIYSLGNYWFNSKERETGLLEITVDTGSMDAVVRFIPCLQKDCRTVQVSKPERVQEMLQYMEDISINAAFDAEGFVTER